MGTTAGISAGTAASRLLGVRIGAQEPERANRAYAAITGEKGRSTAEGQAFELDGARIVLSSNARQAGVWGVDIAVADPGRALAAAGQLGYRVEAGAESGLIHAHGVTVFVHAPPAIPDGKGVESAPGDLRFDHVALLVGEWDAPICLWEALTGIHAHRIDVHPVSNGTFGAARFLLGDQMIELVVPVPGTTSVVATRLATLGEGPVTLALPARDLPAKLAQLKAEGVGTVQRPPHWFVRPPDAAGVLLQLTPRVNH